MTAKNPNPANLEPISEEEEVILLLNADQPAQAAARIRQLESAGKLLLDAIADMLDGNPKTQPELVERYSYRLKLSSWGLPGRKSKALQVKAKSNTSYKPKRRVGSATAAVRGTQSEAAANGLEHIFAASTGDPKKVSDAMLMVKVRGRIKMGISRATAIAEVAKDHNVSVSRVEKAYDTRRHQVRSHTLTKL